MLVETLNVSLYLLDDNETCYGFIRAAFLERENSALRKELEKANFRQV
jgi:hypothetical protein